MQTEHDVRFVRIGLHAMTAEYVHLFVTREDAYSNLPESVLNKNLDYSNNLPKPVCHALTPGSNFARHAELASQAFLKSQIIRNRFFEALKHLKQKLLTSNDPLTFHKENRVGNLYSCFFF